MPHLVVLPDKFRGTATAREFVEQATVAAHAAGWSVDGRPVSDGGEGLLDCFGPANRHTAVSGPDGRTVSAPWRLADGRAVLEMAAASGRALVGAHPDPVAASTRGTGELVAAAITAGATTVIVGAGGSATTDGGQGAVEVLAPLAPLDGSRGWLVVVATDVRTPFLDAARIFGPQKGASPEQVEQLTRRLAELARGYRDEYGVDVTERPGAGAAGGLGGGLAALGARLRPGFELVAEQLDLAGALVGADLVITGEGRLDPPSFDGKAPGGVLALAAGTRVPAALVVGTVAAGTPRPVPTIALDERFGPRAAVERTLDCVRRAVAELLTAASHRPQILS